MTRPAVQEPKPKRQKNGSDSAKQQKKRTATDEAGGKAAKPKPHSNTQHLTVKEIEEDRITVLAKQHWSSEVRAGDSLPPFQPDLVVELYNSELGGGAPAKPPLRRIMLLELSQYLEGYLFPHFNPETSSKEHVLSMIVMINEKFRENVHAWGGLEAHPEVAQGFFDRVVALVDHQVELQQHERTSYLVFLINSFQSLENQAVRGQMLKLVGLDLWHVLPEGRRTVELAALKDVHERWNKKQKREKRKAAKEPDFVPASLRPPATFLRTLLDLFSDALAAVCPVSGEQGAADQPPPTPPPLQPESRLYCERFVELLIDLLSQMPTRRFTHVVLEQAAVLIRAKQSALYSHPKGVLFRQLTDLLQFYLTFPVDDHSGDPASEEASTAAHYEKVQQLQRLAFKYYENLRELSLLNCGAVEDRDVLARHLSALTTEELRHLVVSQLCLTHPSLTPGAAPLDPDFLRDVMLAAYERRTSTRDLINGMPLYPTEGVLWDDAQIPTATYTGEGALALPKLNLQFLTFHDYLIRNFNLFRLEATYEIREDVGDVLRRVNAGYDADNYVMFRGWARMAAPIATFRITEVKKPLVDDTRPAGVTADVAYDTGHMRRDVAEEWDELKEHDVLFLLTIRPPLPGAGEGGGGEDAGPAAAYGLLHVRGCEVIEVKDAEGGLMNDFTGRVRREHAKRPAGTRRTLSVALDTAQYQMDVDARAAEGGEDLYGTFNLLMRRKSKENNFKAVLESIRDLMNQECVLPAWLHDVFLGYGDPGAAHHSAVVASDPSVAPAVLHTVDFKDTFLDEAHLRASFPDQELSLTNGTTGSDTPLPPFRVTFPDPAATAARGGGDGAARPALTAESYTPPDPGPFPGDQPRQNRVRFTPVQVEAIRSGVQPGLSVVVGPPGTGKTDTAVQIMNVLYHNCPGQRTLLIAHSNQALNDLFQKILERDVPERYLLRLGMGEKDLDTDTDFSRAGRVNAMLTRRLELLAQVERLAKQLGVAEAVAYTCESAGHFWLLHVLSRWERYVAAVGSPAVWARLGPGCVEEQFPFAAYFADAPGSVFRGEDAAADWARALGCFRHLRTLFQELEECRAFELLKGQADRVNYLSTKQAKIVAMTCTHAALKRRDFLRLGFQYDNLLMEESAQILEIETFIPMLLQRTDPGGGGGAPRNRLKRVILIGDHHQLPPVVKNQAFQKYCHMEQSLFARFIRLGVPAVHLNAQGRARPALAALYNWRYQELGDLPHTREEPRFTTANPGFAHVFQLVDVPDYNGEGESQPHAHFYQNLGEAEYLVSVFQYMRLLGYPAARISVLSTYNGQKALLRDVFARRCGSHPAFGLPAKVTTVDKYQGQQNDYILLSLVRTRAVGHLRDVRRLGVAASRGRLGLYVFGRAALFAGCHELQPAMSRLLGVTGGRAALELVQGERWEGGGGGTSPCCSRPVDGAVDPVVVQGLPEMVGLLQGMEAEYHAAAAARRAAATAEEEAAAAAEAAAAEEATAAGGGDGDTAMEERAGGDTAVEEGAGGDSAVEEGAGGDSAMEAGAGGESENAVMETDQGDPDAAAANGGDGDAE